MRRNSKKYYEAHKDWYAAYSKKWRLNNKAYIRAHKVLKLAELYVFVNKLKNRPCMDCQGWFDPVCMEFDHRNPKTKRNTVGRMIGNSNSHKTILKEISKCDLVCGNCHAIRTAKQHRAGVFKDDKLHFERGNDTLHSGIS